MRKRIIYYVDSNPGGNLYYSLCINLPYELRQDLLQLDPLSLASFEQFYFTHKDELEIKCYLADLLYAEFMGFWLLMLDFKEQEYVKLMSAVLNNVYISHSRDDAYELIYNHNQDQ